MKNKLTKQIFIACMMIFIVSYCLMMPVLNTYFGKRNLEELRERAVYISAIAEKEGWEFLDSIPQKNTRVTVIQPDGMVIYDSMLDEQELGNHADREEFQEAMHMGEGDSERYSDSWLKKTANYAVRISTGNVVRISMEQDTVLMLVLSMLNSLAVSILLTIFLSIILAARFSRNIMLPINRLDVENPDDRDVYDEMKPFIRRIVSQNQQIHRQMEELKAEHRKQDSMRREFTANVSHELKTPLTSISGFAEIMRDGFVKPEDIPRFSGMIYGEAQRLIVLVNDILKLSKLEAEEGTIREEMQLTELKSICLKSIELLRLNAEKAEVTFICEGEEVQVMGVRGMLEEIILNVCDNAIKYNRPHGTVRVETGTTEEEVFVRITDTGIGIPLADRERIFERFYRVNKSHSKEVGGTGLGLSIVKHGMAYHNARINLESEEGKGTTITLLFVPSLRRAAGGETHS